MRSRSAINDIEGRGGSWANSGEFDQRTQCCNGATTPPDDAPGIIWVHFGAHHETGGRRLFDFDLYGFGVSGHGLDNRKGELLPRRRWAVAHESLRDLREKGIKTAEPADTRDPLFQALRVIIRLQLRQLLALLRRAQLRLLRVQVQVRQRL